jgi:hypothetical protein
MSIVCQEGELSITQWFTEWWRVVRLAGIALVVLALAGPWWYDKIYVPAEYECHRPNIRLEGDFYGVPIAGFWQITKLVNMVPMLVQHTYPGSIGAREIGGLLLWFALTLVLIGPVISMLLRLKRRQTRWLWLHISSLILVIAMVSYALLNLSAYHPILIWGLWLYACSVFLILVEALVAKLVPKRQQTAAM